jgi:hypothetical protein
MISSVAYTIVTVVSTFEFYSFFSLILSQGRGKIIQSSHGGRPTVSGMQLAGIRIGQKRGKHFLISDSRSWKAKPRCLLIQRVGASVSELQAISAMSTPLCYHPQPRFSQTCQSNHFERA